MHILGHFWPKFAIYGPNSPFLAETMRKTSIFLGASANRPSFMQKCHNFAISND